MDYIERYRGKETINSAFVYGYGIYQDGLRSYIIDKNREFIEVMEDSIGIYTELYDMHGKAIYSGDKLIFNMPDTPFWGERAGQENKGYVKYDSDRAGFIIEWDWSRNQHHVELDCDIACEAYNYNEDVVVTSRELIEDLSYSGLTDRIQNDNAKAKEIILALVDDIETSKVEIERTTKILNRHQVNQNYSYTGIERVIRHMKWEFPLVVVAEGKCVTFTEANEYTINKNII